MAKNHTRASKASGSTRRRVDIAIRAGWQPPLPAAWFYRKSRKHGGHHE